MLSPLVATTELVIIDRQRTINNSSGCAQSMLGSAAFSRAHFKGDVGMPLVD
jgi:hypothetical protein